MALDKEKIDNKGIKTIYHKIAGFSTDTKTIKIIVKSFSDKLIRDKETEIISFNKSVIEKLNEVDNIQSDINNLISKNEDGSLNESVSQLTDTLNELIPNIPEKLEEQQLHVYEYEFIVPFVDEKISIKYLYGKLKQLDFFADSKDV